MDDSIIRFDLIEFCSVKESYFCDSSLEVTLKLDPSHNVSPDDKVCLFKVGWMNTSERVAEVKVSDDRTAGIHRVITFDANMLPDDEDNFYHLCYITSTEKLAGVSIPFQFIANDFEIINEESSNIEHISVDKLSSQKPDQLSNFKKENEELRVEVETLKTERDSLSKEIEMLKKTLVHSDMDGILLALETANNDLKDRVRKLQKENLEMKGKLNPPKQSPNQVVNSAAAPVSMTSPKSFSFMDSYYEDNTKIAVSTKDEEVAPPPGFVPTYPSTWITYENHPDTLYPEPTWFPNPFVNYKPSSWTAC